MENILKIALVKKFLLPHKQSSIHFVVSFNWAGWGCKTDACLRAGIKRKIDDPLGSCRAFEMQSRRRARFFSQGLKPNAKFTKRHSPSLSLSFLGDFHNHGRRQLQFKEASDIFHSTFRSFNGTDLESSEWKL